MQVVLGSINLAALWPVVALLVLLGGVYLLVLILKAKPNAKETPAANGEPEFLPYTLRDGVLTAGERAFFPVLIRAVRMVAAERQASDPLVLAKVRLADIVEVAPPTSDSTSLTNSQRTTAQNRINSKHVDFVVCHPQTTRPIVVVELDDGSHSLPHRQARDEFVDRVCASGTRPIRVLHVRASSSYDPASLAKQIQESCVPMPAVVPSGSVAKR